MQESQLLEFLEDFVGGQFYNQIRCYQQEMIDAKKDVLAQPGQTYEQMVFIQGEIQGLEFDPLVALLEELKQKQTEIKERNEH